MHGNLWKTPRRHNLYFQSNEEGLRRCLQVLIALSNKDSAKVEAYKVANIQHNIQQRLFPNSIFVRSMEAPLEREIKSAGSGKNQAKKEKSSLEQRLQLTKTMFQLIGFIRKQAPVSIFIITECTFQISSYSFL